jgi:hypothetical protein
MLNNMDFIFTSFILAVLEIELRVLRMLASTLPQAIALDLHNFFFSSLQFVESSHSEPMGR